MVDQTAANFRELAFLSYIGNGRNVIRFIEIFNDNVPESAVCRQKPVGAIELILSPENRHIFEGQKYLTFSAHYL